MQETLGHMIRVIPSLTEDICAPFQSTLYVGRSSELGITREFDKIQSRCAPWQVCAGETRRWRKGLERSEGLSRRTTSRSSRRTVFNCPAKDRHCVRRTMVTSRLFEAFLACPTKCFLQVNRAVNYRKHVHKLEGSTG
jgi:hypothetical protein